MTFTLEMLSAIVGRPATDNMRSLFSSLQDVGAFMGLNLQT